MPPPETQYEHGATPEFAQGTLGYWPWQVAQAFWPQRREVLEEGGTSYYDLGDADGVTGQDRVLAVDYPGEYGPRQYHPSYAPVYQTGKKIAGGIGALITDPEARARAWSAAKSLPAAALEAVSGHLADQQLLSSAFMEHPGIKGLYKGDNQEVKIDPLLPVWGGAPVKALDLAGIKGLFPASGPYLGSFGGRIGAARSGKGFGFKLADEMIEEHEYKTQQNPDLPPITQDPNRHLTDLWEHEGVFIGGEKGRQFPQVEFSDADVTLTPALTSKIEGTSKRIREEFEEPLREQGGAILEPDDVPYENVKRVDSDVQLSRALDEALRGGDPSLINIGETMPLRDAVHMPQLQSIYSGSIPIPELRQQYNGLYRLVYDPKERASLTPEQLKSAEAQLAHLSYVLKHPELAEFKPLGEIPVQLSFDPKSPLASFRTSASYSRPVPGSHTESMTIYAPSFSRNPVGKGLSSLLHEIGGHAVQAREGLPGGSSPIIMERIYDFYTNRKAQKDSKPLGSIQKEVDAFLKKADWLIADEIKLIKSEIAKGNRDPINDETILNLAKERAFNYLYRLEIGEIGAYTIQGRAGLPTLIREITPPYGENLGGADDIGRLLASEGALPHMGIDTRGLQKPFIPVIDQSGIRSLMLQENK